MFRWEEQARKRWGKTFRCQAWVAYDRLIDHALLVPAAPFLNETIWACRVFHRWRKDIEPRTLVMPIQGTNRDEYETCAKGVLAVCRPHDWIGLGGWCYLGRRKSHLPRFVACLESILPRVAAAGIQQLHIFGVLWDKALAQLLRLTKPYGFRLSTDSSVPLNLRGWKGQPGPFPDHAAAATYWRRHLRRLTPATSN